MVSDMMTAEQLKNSILQLAMQGKLVEQRPEEGTGEELYREIQVERKRLIKEGKIKKQKPLPEITEDEIPFEIPESWEWVRVGHVFNLQAGKNKTSSEIGEVQTDILQYPCYGGNGKRGYVKDYNRDGVYALIGRQGALCGNINIASGKFYATEHAVVVEHFCSIDVRWSGYFLRALNLNQYATATAQPGLSVANINRVLIPIPPIAEQKRIVAKIEELMPFVEQYAAASTKLNTLNTTFPDMMKKSILQEAVQGKLVQQDPNDEPSSVLLKKIAEEKKRLIKEGKIKKQKPLPEITEDEIPFEIPESWEWVRFGSVLKLLTDGTHKTPHYVAEGVPFISVKDMSSGNLSFTNTKFITEKEADELNTRCNPERGDVLLSKVGTTGVPASVDTDIKFSLFVSVALLKFNKDLINRDYLINVINSPCVQKQCAENTRGVGNKNWVMRDIANTLIPIAPLREQERIASELKRIMPQFSVLEQEMDR